MSLNNQISSKKHLKLRLHWNNPKLIRKPLQSPTNPSLRRKKTRARSLLNL
jgi:hypothetical protein